MDVLFSLMADKEFISYFLLHVSSLHGFEFSENIDYYILMKAALLKVFNLLKIINISTNKQYLLNIFNELGIVFRCAHCSYELK